MEQTYTKQDLLDLQAQTIANYDRLMNMDVSALANLFEEGLHDQVEPFNKQIIAITTGYYMLLNNIQHAIENFKPEEATF